MEAVENLRIVTLFPGATEICIALGLEDHIVGRTHECKNPWKNCRVVTASGLPDSQTQQEIHQAVSSGSNNNSNVPSLYPILESEFQAARPNLIITQDLCAVCGPTSASVDDSNLEARILSLSPKSLLQVVESFQTVADACDVADRGRALCTEFQQGVQLINEIVERHSGPRPSILLFEWLDPPFLAGHWISDMTDAAGISNLMPFTKSEPLEWSRIAATADPDVVVVACCGRDLSTNIQDTMDAAQMIQRHCPRAVANHKVFACNGDAYFVKPGPNLLIGVAILALVAYEDHPDIVQAIQSLAFVPDDLSALWKKVSVQDCRSPSHASLPDIEDFDKLHEIACAKGELTYIDPATGYSVFTELAHTKRGVCCGSGCRHCPFAHENVTDSKAQKIQQPAFLYRASEKAPFPNDAESLRVLFFSGGKDSFLTVRALVRELKSGPAFGLVLLTTFDASSRIIAHQNVPITTVERQASHLDISLVGVPLHRGSSESYLSKIEQSIDLILKDTSVQPSNTTLVFGDLHLEHIKDWRDNQLGKLGFDLQYPLFNVPYSKMEEDLEASQVPCIISSSTVPTVRVGDNYDSSFRQKLSATDVDVFGENGEFHSVSQVWNVESSVALGLHGSE